MLRLDEKRFVYLDVDDAPFVARSLRWEGERAIAVLSDGSEEALDLASVHLRHGVAYALVKHELEARLSPAAFNTLSERIVERDGAHFLGSLKLD